MNFSVKVGKPIADFIIILSTYDINKTLKWTTMIKVSFFFQFSNQQNLLSFSKKKTKDFRIPLKTLVAGSGQYFTPLDELIKKNIKLSLPTKNVFK